MVKPAAADAPLNEDGPRAFARSVALAAGLIVLGVSALVLPWPLQRPIWVKAEIVFAVWWVVWAIALTLMLYRGVSLRSQPTSAAETSSGYGASRWIGFENADFGHAADADGAHMIAALVMLIVLLLVIWLVVEVIAPLLVPVGYAVVWWMLARVLRSSERCKGNMLRSLAHGLMWASTYTLPPAIGVALLHAVF